jgi:hypothetical protein
MSDGPLRSVARRNRLLAALPAAHAEQRLLSLRHVVLPNERVLLAPRDTVQ